MDNIYEFHDRASIESEASEWLILLERETPPSSSEREALREWLARSPAHREEIDRLARFWGSMNILTELAVPLGKGHGQELDKVRSGVGWASRFGGLAVAASLMTIVTVVVLAYVGLLGGRSEQGLYATVVGQQKTVVLGDGSVVELNTNTQLEVHYTQGFRDIYLLQGEAHFTVAKEPDWPFRVRAGNGQVKAIGTAFSVYLDGQSIDVTVTEGKVGLAVIEQLDPDIGQSSQTTAQSRTGLNRDRGDKRGADIVISKQLGSLKAGQGSTILPVLSEDAGADSHSTIVRVVDQSVVNKRLNWRNGLLKFAGDPLEDVIDEISRYTELSIEIDEPEVRAISIGGQFKVGEIEAVLESLETNFGIHVKRVDNKKVLLSSSRN